MKRLLVLLQAWVLPCWLFAQNYAPFLAHYVGDQTHSINQTFTESDTIVLSNYGTVYSLSINATIQQPNEGSFVRIVMEDANGYDYLVAESDWMRNDTTTVNFSGYCEETAKLPGIVPSLLKCYVSDATIVIHSTQTSAFPILSAPSNISNDSIRRLQVQNIVDRINIYNENKGKLWRATLTDTALQPYSIRKRILSLSEECSSQGMEYYAGGIFDMGYTEIRSNSTNTSPFVETFDWRNRHGKNWMTPVQNQGKSGYCWAFSSVAATESLINLYFNRNLDIDLSEQDVAYYSYPEYHNDSVYEPYFGGSFLKALTYIKNNGVIDDPSLPFIDDSIPGLPHVRTNQYFNLVKISGSALVSSAKPDSSKLEKIKKFLIEKGPLVSGFRWMPKDSIHTMAHAMALVGYGRIHAGDTLQCYNHYWAGSGKLVVPNNSPYIGETYWIFKNSYGINDGHGHGGYMYILFKDLWSFYKTYYIKTPITSINYTNADILVEDLDCDGYFNWGIGPKPAHCPAWAPDEADGDDSDYTKGPMDEYGYCAELDSLRKRYIYIDHDTTLTSPLPVHNHIVVWKGATVKTEHTVSFEDGTELIVDNGATLIVENLLENVTLRAMPGSHIIVKYNSAIIPYRNFEIPQGVTLEMQNKTSIE